MKVRIKRMVLFGIACLLSFGCMAINTSTSSAATTYKWKANGAAFYVDGMTGVCCHRGTGSSTSGTATRVRLKNSDPAAKVAWYAAYKKGLKYSNKSSKSGQWNTLKKLMQCAGNDNWGYPHPGSQYTSDYSKSADSG